MPSSQTSVQSTQSKRRNAEDNSSPKKEKVVSTLGPGDRIGEGDTELVLDILPPDLAQMAFENLRKEVKWNVMHHRGGEVPRLVAVEGEVLPDGSYPIYRHPADSSPPLLPFSPTVSLIRAHVEAYVKHPLNHALIQHYRTGADYISEHSDKTIDIVKGSNIVNVSIGAERVMTLRTKKDALPKAASTSDPSTPPDPHTGEEEEGVRRTERVPLPHNSLFVMGLSTNARWMHSIRTDKRPKKTKSASEQYNNGERISLTLRYIGTYLTPSKNEAREEVLKIWGQGAKGKTREEAGEVVCGGRETQELLDAFGAENHQSEFDWEGTYGKGSDVLHFKKEDEGA